MAIPSTTQDGEGGTDATGGLGRADAPSRELVTGTIGNRCANCGSPLASDQRYCVECGERRGTARFAVEPSRAVPAAAAARPRKRLSRPSGSSGVTLVAGIATLLLAMGVGIEIGKSGNQKPAPAQKVVVVGGGSGPTSGTTASTPTTNTTASTSSNRHTSSKAKTTAAKKTVVTKVVAQKAQAAATKVLGAAAPKNPTVKQGQTCTGGATQGCQNGKFTGVFFGGQ
jgi:hypothetical protein